MVNRSESGVALIAVLLFLLLIAIAGMIAVRQGSLDLRVATNEQADVLMLNSSDSVLAHIETVAGDNNHPLRPQMMSQTRGVLGYFIPIGGANANPNEKVDHQVRFCYTPNAQTFFDVERARVLLPGGGTMRTNDGACNPNNAQDYISGRNTVMTQVVTRGLTSQTADSDNFKLALEGEQTGAGLTPPSSRIAMHSVSMLPGLSSAGSADIRNCMDMAVGDITNANYGNNFGTRNLTTCLQEQGVPAKAIVEEATLRFEREADVCDNAQLAADGTCRAPTP
ncbi:hypothetical protein [Moraxella bovis]|uniref:hypothetical protein n=1 Tax=Moraxella bovis TaxID=476 RepID=UPI002225F37A|nr:hypothetical protein [Moraxella bovis]UYZ81145.1 hypothetical protein LP113_14320 [Moraxella bovis]